jgi:hypothetical protein
LSPSSPKVKEDCSFVSTELIRSFAHSLVQTFTCLLIRARFFFGELLDYSYLLDHSLLLSSPVTAYSYLLDHSSPLSFPVTAHPYLSQSQLTLIFPNHVSSSLTCVRSTSTPSCHDNSSLFVCSLQVPPLSLCFYLSSSDHNSSHNQTHAEFQNVSPFPRISSHCRPQPKLVARSAKASGSEHQG